MPGVETGVNVLVCCNNHGFRKHFSFYGQIILLVFCPAYFWRRLCGRQSTYLVVRMDLEGDSTVDYTYDFREIYEADGNAVSYT